MFKKSLAMMVATAVLLSTCSLPVLAQPEVGSQQDRTGTIVFQDDFESVTELKTDAKLNGLLDGMNSGWVVAGEAVPKADATDPNEDLTLPRRFVQVIRQDLGNGAANQFVHMTKYADQEKFGALGTASQYQNYEMTAKLEAPVKTGAIAGSGNPAAGLILRAQDRGTVMKNKGTRYKFNESGAAVTASDGISVILNHNGNGSYTSDTAWNTNTGKEEASRPKILKIKTNNEDKNSSAIPVHLPSDVYFVTGNVGTATPITAMNGAVDTRVVDNGREINIYGKSKDSGTGSEERHLARIAFQENGDGTYSTSEGTVYEYADEDGSVIAEKEAGTFTGANAPVKGYISFAGIFTPMLVDDVVIKELDAGALTDLRLAASQTTLTMKNQETAKLSVTADFEEVQGKEIPAGREGLTFTSGRPDIAAVNNQTGLVTPVSSGKATITAEYTIGAVTKTATVEITVAGEDILFADDFTGAAVTGNADLAAGVFREKWNITTGGNAQVQGTSENPYLRLSKAGSATGDNGQNWGNIATVDTFKNYELSARLISPMRVSGTGGSGNPAASVVLRAGSDNLNTTDMGALSAGGIGIILNHNGNALPVPNSDDANQESKRKKIIKIKTNDNGKPGQYNDNIVVPLPGGLNYVPGNSGVQNDTNFDTYIDTRITDNGKEINIYGTAGGSGQEYHLTRIIFDTAEDGTVSTSAGKVYAFVDESGNETPESAQLVGEFTDAKAPQEGHIGFTARYSILMMDNLQVKALPLGALTDITVRPAVLRLGLGQESTLKVSGLYENAEKEIDFADVEASVTDGTVASLDQTGKVTGLKDGSTTITVSYGGKTKEVPVEVSGLTGLRAVPASIATEPGRSSLMTLLGVYGETEKPVAFGEGVIAVSSNPEVAAVDQSSGKVTGVKAGETSITISYEGKEATVPVYVLEPQPAYFTDNFESNLDGISFGANLPMNAVFRDNWFLPDFSKTAVSGLTSASETYMQLVEKENNHYLHLGKLADGDAVGTMVTASQYQNYELRARLQAPFRTAGITGSGNPNAGIILRSSKQYTMAGDKGAILAGNNGIYIMLNHNGNATHGTGTDGDTEAGRNKYLKIKWNSSADNVQDMITVPLPGGLNYVNGDKGQDNAAQFDRYVDTRITDSGDEICIYGTNRETGIEYLIATIAFDIDQGVVSTTSGAVYGYANGVKELAGSFAGADAPRTGYIGFRSRFTALLIDNVEVRAYDEASVTTSIHVNPEALEMTDHSRQTLTMSATVAGQEKALLFGKAGMTVKSSDPSVASVDPATGEVTAWSVGTAVITIEYAGLTASVTVNVKQGGPEDTFEPFVEDFDETDPAKYTDILFSKDASKFVPLLKEGAISTSWEAQAFAFAVKNQYQNYKLTLNEKIAGYANPNDGANSFAGFFIRSKDFGGSLYDVHGGNIGETGVFVKYTAVTEKDTEQSIHDQTLTLIVRREGNVCTEFNLAVEDGLDMRKGYHKVEVEDKGSVITFTIDGVKRAVLKLDGKNVSAFTADGVQVGSTVTDAAIPEKGYIGVAVRGQWWGSTVDKLTVEPADFSGEAVTDIRVSNAGSLANLVKNATVDVADLLKPQVQYYGKDWFDITTEGVAYDLEEVSPAGGITLEGTTLKVNQLSAAANLVVSVGEHVVRVPVSSANADVATLRSRYFAYAWQLPLTGDAETDQALAEKEEYQAIISQKNEAGRKALANVNLSADINSSSSIYLDGFVPNMSATGSDSAVPEGLYKRISPIAQAYITPGTEGYQNAEYRKAIDLGLGWAAKHYYNKTTAKAGNWYQWEIDAARELSLIFLYLSDDLTQQEMKEYGIGLEKYNPDPRYYADTNGATTGANRSWKALSSFYEGIGRQDSDKIKLAVTTMESIMKYATAGTDMTKLDYSAGEREGFYPDGSELSHGYYPYAFGGYGLGDLDSQVRIKYMVGGTGFDFKPELADNIYNWVIDSFAPSMFKGQVLTRLEGRGVGENHGGYTGALEYMLILSDIAPEGEYKTSLRTAAKQLMVDNGMTVVNSTDITRRVSTDIMNDDTIQTEIEDYAKVFAMMDVASQRSGDYLASVAMYSKGRARNYESINYQNEYGWHSGSGVLQVYTTDQDKYNRYFTSDCPIGGETGGKDHEGHPHQAGYVDEYRLPGTTILSGSKAASGQPNSSNYAGGATFNGRYAAVGFEYNQSKYAPIVMNDSGKEQGYTTLFAKKSYFMLDGKIVAVGSDIDSAEEQNVETIVDNMRLNSARNNRLSVNGASVSGTGDAANASYAYLQGNVASGSGSGMGYYFPQAVTLKTNRTEDGFQQLYLDHGAKIQDQKYAYVMIPGATEEDMAEYAKQPDIRILKQDETVHAVEDLKTGMVAANFFAAGECGILSADGPASVMYQQGADGTMKLTVAEPTQRSEKVVITLKGNFTANGGQDDRIQITPGGETTITFSSKFSKGASYEVNLTEMSGTYYTVAVDQNPAAGSTVTASFTAKPYGAEKDYIVMEALYCGDTLVSAKEIASEAIKSGGLTSEVTVPSQAGAYTLKYFTWASLESLQPEYEAVVFPAQGK